MTTRYRATGRTIDHRDAMKLHGGMWNPDAKAWEFTRLKPRDLEDLRSLVGVIVTEVPKEPERDTSWVDELLASLGVGYVESDEYKPTQERIGRTNVFGDDQTWLNYFADKNPISYFGFSNLAALVRYVALTPEDHKERSSAWNITRDMSWSGSRTMEQAFIIARDGWTAGVDKARQIVEHLDVAHATQRRRKHSVAGGSVNVGRMLSGNPQHMRQRPKQPGKRVVTLFIETAMNCGMESENSVIRAAAIAAIVDIMEHRGYSCEIVATTMVEYGPPAFQVVTNLKQAGEKLNLDDMIFALGHPAYFRRLCFGCAGRDEDLRRVWATMGRPSTAFRNGYPTKTNEFYFNGLSYEIQEAMKGGTMIDRAMRLIPLIIPAGFPLEIEK